MVAYSFQRRFAGPILDGSKGGTIRAPRKWRYGAGPSAEIGGHAYPGQELQLYTGMRTKQCRLITRKTCLVVDRVRLHFGCREIALASLERYLRATAELDAFARFDGFADFEDMTTFWRDNRASRRPGEDGVIFDGWHIRWMALPAVIAGTRA